MWVTLYMYVIVWQIVVAALAFFLGKDEENKDKEDSDSDQEVHWPYTVHNPLTIFP